MDTLADMEKVNTDTLLLTLRALVKVADEIREELARREG